MTENKRFIDIEVSADIGQVRLYVDDENYESYTSRELLDLLNGFNDEICELKERLLFYENPSKVLQKICDECGIEIDRRE